MLIGIFSLLASMAIAQTVSDDYTTYKTFQNGEHVNTVRQNKKKYDQTISNDKVFYVKSLGIMIESNSKNSTKPIDRVISDCKTSAESCFILAAYYEEVSDIDNAASYYEKACVHGDMKSCQYAGSHYHHRLMNYPKAIKTFSPPCDKKDWLSCFNLAHSYRLNKDETSAMKNFVLSCDNGFVNACIELAYTYKEQSKYKESLKIFTTYCDKADGLSCEQAALLSKALNAPAETKRFKDLACKHGVKTSCK